MRSKQKGHKSGKANKNQQVKIGDNRRKEAIIGHVRSRPTPATSTRGGCDLGTNSLFAFWTSLVSDNSGGGGLGGGGGVLSLEKGTYCGPTAGKLWLTRADIAKKRADVQSL